MVCVSGHLCVCECVEGLTVSVEEIHPQRGVVASLPPPSSLFWVLAEARGL
jgi:hypothetical protein